MPSTGKHRGLYVHTRIKPYKNGNDSRKKKKKTEYKEQKQEE
jgi:hypothetical protein